jgi:hypothetical protein
MTRRRVASILLVLAALGVVRLHGTQSFDSINEGELKQWLGYIASDELEGRAVFSDGLGLAAGYIEAHLRDWGVKPAGDGGTYLQVVRVLGVDATSRSSVTVRVRNEVRTFKDRQGVTFPRNPGAKQTVVLNRVEFVGYGLDAPETNMGLKDKNFDGAAVVFLGAQGPKELDEARYRRILDARARRLTETTRAAATIGPPPTAPGPPSGGDPNAPDFTTTRRLDHLVPPAAQGSDELFKFLFSSAPVRYDELKRRASAREPLPSFRLDGVTVTFNVDVDYAVVRTQLTQNVVGVVEGSDPKLRSEYVAFGAHYDHLGFAERELEANGRRPAAPGRVTTGHAEDRIWNGADDDGSGTVALMAVARAYAQGPRPKRSLLFVWHAGEERGLLGSRYFADYPTVPLDRIVAQLNIDMVGRNRDDMPTEANTVYLVGSDRISSELHQVSRDANAALRVPLTLDYELNDPADPEQVYYRSDHYSYAAKGIPIVFFTTGLHPDYHANTDEVSRIEFPKMTRITQLVFETGRRVANLDHAVTRDNKGPRAGKATR